MECRELLQINWMYLVAALIPALLANPLWAQDAEADSQNYTDLDGLEAIQFWSYAAFDAESQIKAMRESGADPAEIRRLECRLVRLKAQMGIHDEAQAEMQAALVGLSGFDPVTLLGCRVDQVIQLRQSGRSREALPIATATLAELDAVAHEEPVLLVRAATELAHTLYAERRYEEAAAMHERALALSLAAEDGGRELELRNRLALVDLAFQAGELRSQLPVLEAMLETAVERYGEDSLWVADVLERLGAVEYRQRDLSRGVRILELASAIRTPDPVGLLPEEYRTGQVVNIMLQRTEMRRGEPVSATWFMGAGVTPFMGLRYSFGLDHPDRIEVASRHVAAELAVLRYPDKREEAADMFTGVLGAEEAHHASREALAGLIERISRNGVGEALPDRFNPLGELTATDVVFTHVDALWYDSHDRHEMAEAADAE